MTGILNLLAGAVGVVKDTYFNLVTLLLPGNGTNGAQNNTFLDSSTNNFTITRNGGNPGMMQGTFSPFSQTGWSINNTTDEHGIKTSSSVAIGTSVFTMEFWIYFTNTPSTGTIGFCADGTNNSGIFYGDLTSLGFGPANVGLNLSGTPGFTLNAWFHVAVARDSSNRMSIWVNGSRIATATGITANYATAPMAMGGSGFRYQGYCSNGRLVVGTAVYDPTATTITVPTSPLTAITNTSVLLGTSNRFNDASANNYGITVTGTPSVQAFSPFAPTAAYSASTNGGSGYFDGTGDYLSVGAAADWAFMHNGSDWTCEFWVYHTGTAAYTIVSTTAFSAEIGFTLAINSTYASGLVNGVQLYIVRGSSGSEAIFNSTALLAVNQWNYVAVTFTSSTKTCAFTINGASAGSTANTGFAYSSSSPTNTLAIGRYQGSTPSNYLVGYLSSLRISTNVRTGLTTVPTSPYTSDANTKLLTNYTNAGITDATAKNDLETVGGAQISTTQSKFGGSSMYFDGTGDELYFPSGTNFDLGTTYTIECWVYPSSVASNFGIILRGSYDTGAGNWTGLQFSLRWLTGQGLRAYFYGTTFSNEQTITSSSTALVANQWQHIAMVRNGTSGALYIDGVSVGTVSSLNTPAASTQPIRIGNWKFVTGDNYFNGYIDDFRITKGYARYTSAFTPPTAPFALQ